MMVLFSYIFFYFYYYLKSNKTEISVWYGNEVLLQDQKSIKIKFYLFIFTANFVIN